MSRPAYQQLLTVLPCHSLEDFPLHLRGEQASSLLACWTAPWHPALLHSAGSLPKWCRADQLPDLTEQSVVLVPLSATSQLPLTPEELAGHSANFLLSPLSRKAAWEQLELSSSPPPPSSPTPATPELTADDFAALGYGYLQLQLLTRRLRYSHTLDEEKLTELALSAATAYLEARPQHALENLQAAYDLLLAERNRYYPVDAQLVELWMLDAAHPPAERFPPSRKVNLLLPLDTARHWETDRPELLAEVATAAQAGQAQVLGTTNHCLPELLLTTAPLLAEYLDGRGEYQRLFGLPPSVFGRRQGTLHPAQPPMLNSLGYRGALHLPLGSDCRVPQAAAATLGWQGLGQQTIDAITSDPLDASAAESFLGLAIEIGQQIDSAHQATIVLAHWPGQSCEAFADLIRISRISSLLGRFVTCDELFDTLYHPSYGDRYDYDDYRPNSLFQWTVEGRLNPISASVVYSRLQSEWLALRHANTLVAPFNSTPRTVALELETALRQLSQLSLPPTPGQLANWEASRSKLEGQLREIRRELANAAQACFSTGDPQQRSTATALLHPHFAPSRNRYVLRTEASALPPTTPPLLLAERQTEETAVVVDLPASGLAFLPTSGGRPSRSSPSMVVDKTIRNEFFELEIDPHSGGIRRLRPHQSRQTLLSQRLGLLIEPKRESPDDPQAGYARMRADSIAFDTSRPLQASCLTTGSLVYGEETWANFRQRLVVSRGLRTIEFHIDVEIVRELSGNPWAQYLCSRLAWNDEPLGRYRGIHDTHQAVRLEKFLAPTYVHIDNGYQPLTLFCDGLPWHRQSGLRILDSLLVVAQESARSFSFGLGIGLESPQVTASQRGAQPIEFAAQSTQAAQQRLFHLSARNLQVVDSWPTFDAAEHCSGAVLRFRESLGKSGKATLYAPRKLKGARLLDLSGSPLEALTVRDDQVALEYHGYKLFTLQLYW